MVIYHRGDNPTNCKKKSYGLGQSSVLVFAGKHIFEKSRDFGHLDAQKKIYPERITKQREILFEVLTRTL